MAHGDGQRDDAAPHRRDEDGSLRLRIRLASDLADLVEQVAPGRALIPYIRAVLRDAAPRDAHEVNRGGSCAEVYPPGDPGTGSRRGAGDAKRVGDRRTDHRARPAQRLYTVDQAAASLGISASTLFRQIRAGQVAHTKLGRRVGLSDAQIDAIARSGERDPLQSQRPSSRRRTNL